VEAVATEEIVFPRRSFRDVHQLVFLFQSWQLVLQEADLPPALQPLKDIPEDLSGAVTRALRAARDQLEAAQAGSEITLRFPATPEFEALMRWADLQFLQIEGLLDDPNLDPTWAQALALARDLVNGALEQIATREPQI
jgi:hypothetical protein